jgi:hypothetical protein
MKILKRQQGGLQYIHVPTIYGDNNAQTTQASEKKSDGTASDTVKELYSAIRQEGLPVDVSMFLYKAQEILSEPDYGLGSSDNTFTKIIQLHDLANRVKWNMNEMKRAQKNIDESDTGDDYAIASDGKFYVMDANRKITTMSYDDIKENSDKYMMLTNSQLLQERANTFGNNMETRMINDVANYIGMNEVMDDIRGVVKEFGNNELKGYLAKAPGKVIKGFEDLYELMNDGPNGLYEFQAKDSTAKSNILAAASYIINNLNRNAQKTLKANADLNGIDVSKMVLSAIIDHTDSSYEVEKVDDNTGAKSSGSGGSGSGSLVQDNWGRMVFMDHGSPIPYNFILGNNVRTTLPAKMYNSFIDKDNKQIMVSRMNQTYSILQEWGLVDSLGTSYFGNISINDINNSGQDVIIDNSKGMAVIWMPVNSAGKIDFNMFSKMGEIQNYIISNRITDENQVKEI